MKRNASINSIVIVIALLLVLVIFIGEAIRSNSLSLQNFDKGIPLPNFALPELFDPEKSLTNEDLKGQVCLLNFWASWCSACHKEHNTLLLISKQFHIPVFGITFKDTAEDSKRWLEEFGNPYAAIGTDPSGKTAINLAVFGIPITYIIDKHGIARYRYLGTITMSAWETEIKPIVDQLEHEN